MNNRKAIVFLILSISSIPVSKILNIYVPIRLTYAVVVFIFFFILSSYKLLNDFKFESKYFNFIFFLFLLYEFTIVIRGWSFSSNELREFITVNYLFWPFVVPLFVFFNKSFSSIAYLIKYCYYLCLIFLSICFCFPTLLLTREFAQTLIGTFAIGSGFLLLNGKYLANRKVNVSFIVALISLLSLIFVARRNGIVTFSGFIISGYIVNRLNKSKALLFRIFPLIFAISIFLILSFSNFSSSLTKNLSERFFDDTRSGLFEMYFIDMSDHMLFGKGLNGTYYFPTGGVLQDDGVTRSDIVDDRNVIENGFLQLILNGGIVHVVLFLLVLIPAAINGIFKSSNQFSKACGVLILLWLLDMFVFGLPQLTLQYLLIWICVGICYKSSIRSKTDDEIMTEFQKFNLT